MKSFPYTGRVMQDVQAHIGDQDVTIAQEGDVLSLCKVQCAKGHFWVDIEGWSYSADEIAILERPNQ